MQDTAEASYAHLLDQIYFLRSLLAMEATVVEGHLAFKTFPTTRRQYSERSVDRMRRAARGVVNYTHIAGVSPAGLASNMTAAGASAIFEPRTLVPEGDPLFGHLLAAQYEVRELQVACATEARILECAVDYAAFPKSRRGIALAQIERLRAAAAGTPFTLTSTECTDAMRSAGADVTLTRSQWEGRATRR